MGKGTACRHWAKVSFASRASENMHKDYADFY